MREEREREGGREREQESKRQRREMPWAGRERLELNSVLQPAQLLLFTHEEHRASCAGSAVLLLLFPAIIYGNLHVQNCKPPTSGHRSA